jgi:light-independent protochlorophyllide reductase subunit N
MTILNESGIPDVLPPLHAVSNLAQRLGDVLVVVAGTQAEAHLVQCLPAAPSPNLPPSRLDPRVVFAILDPDDPPPQGLLASRIVESAAGMRNINLVLLVAARPTKALGVDAAFEARLASRKLDLPVEVVDPEAPHEIPGTLSTDLDDGVVSALVDLCPKRRTSDLVETASAPKRGGLLGGLLGRGREVPE